MLTPNTTESHRTRKVSYVHAIARCLKRFGNFIVEEDLAEQSFYHNIKLPKNDTQIKFTITNDDLAVLLKHCSMELHKIILLFMCDSGVRMSELCSLNVENLDMKSGRLQIVGKGNKWRVVYVGNQVLKRLQKHWIKTQRKPQGNEPLFLNRNGHRMEYPALQAYFYRLSKRSGIEKFSGHSTRRYYATSMLRNGTDLATLQRLMGHENIAVTMRYLDLVEDDLEMAQRKFGVLDNL